MAFFYFHSGNTLLLSEICALGFFSCMFFFSEFLDRFQILLWKTRCCCRSETWGWDSWEGQQYVAMAAPNTKVQVVNAVQLRGTETCQIQTCCAHCMVKKVVSKCFLLRPQCPSCQRLQELVAEKIMQRRSWGTEWTVKPEFGALDQVLSGSLDLHHGIQFRDIHINICVWSSLSEEFGKKHETKWSQITCKPLKSLLNLWILIQNAWNQCETSWSWWDSPLALSMVLWMVARHTTSTMKDVSFDQGRLEASSNKQPLFNKGWPLLNDSYGKIRICLQYLLDWRLWLGWGITRDGSGRESSETMGAEMKLDRAPLHN